MLPKVMIAEFMLAKFMLIFSLQHRSNNRFHKWPFFHDFDFVTIISKRFHRKTFRL